MAGRRLYSQLLFTIRLQFQPTNNEWQKNKQWTFSYKFSSGSGLDDFQIPPHRQAVSAIPNFKMKLFPTKELNFRLVNDQAETLDRLNRRTERSDNLTSQFTDKSFRGQIDKNEFKLISSTIGRGAFCVMSGQINSVDGSVKVEIHKVFQILLTIILLLPLVGFLIMAINQTDKFSPIMILVAIGQILMIRYVFIELVFRFLSRESLNRLKDVLDFDWIKN